MNESILELLRLKYPEHAKHHVAAAYAVTRDANDFKCSCGLPMSLTFTEQAVRMVIAGGHVRVARGA